MFKFKLLTAALALAAPGAQAQASADRPLISWSIAPAGYSDVSKVQLTIESRWGPTDRSIWSNSRNISELPGLSAVQLRGPPAPARFALGGDAGRLDCSGTAG